MSDQETSRWTDYTHLPVYRDAFNLVKWSYTGSLQRVARMYRYTLLEPARNALRELLLSVYDVTVTEDRTAKVTAVDRCLREVEHASILFLLLYETGAIRTSQITYLTGELSSVTRQLHGWRKSLLSSGKG